MFTHPEIPDRPDVKQGGRGDERWIEIDFFWERAGVCILLDQPERHSRYTRALDLDRDELLTDLGVQVLRFGRDHFDRDPAGTMSRVRELLDARRDERRPVYRPPRARAVLVPREPLVNVTRTIAWLEGVPGARAVPQDWPRHYDVDRITWNYQPGDGTYVGCE